MIKIFVKQNVRCELSRCACSRITSMQPVSERPNFVKNEEAIAELWVKIDAFQTSLKMNADKPMFSFYDGPPFATGKPHYGHILVCIDMFCLF